MRPPLIAGSIVAFDGGQASLLFDGATKFGAEDRTVITGSLGTLNSRGPDLGVQEVTLTTEAGIARPALEGTWFKEGFRGTMGALLEAVEKGTQPLNDARGSLDALAMVFAADRLGPARRAGRARRDPQPQGGGGVEWRTEADSAAPMDRDGREEGPPSHSRPAGRRIHPSDRGGRTPSARHVLHRSRAADYSPPRMMVGAMRQAATAEG